MKNTKLTCFKANNIYSNSNISISDNTSLIDKSISVDCLNDSLEESDSSTLFKRSKSNDNVIYSQTSSENEWGNEKDNQEQWPSRDNERNTCISERIKAISDKYFKSNKIIVKLYNSNNSSISNNTNKKSTTRRQRSFSFGALPGLENLKDNPLYNEEEDYDDSDSGIVNSSTNSSVVDDHYDFRVGRKDNGRRLSFDRTQIINKCLRNISNDDSYSSLQTCSSPLVSKLEESTSKCNSPNISTRSTTITSTCEKPSFLNKFRNSPSNKSENNHVPYLHVQSDVYAASPTLSTRSQDSSLMSEKYNLEVPDIFNRNSGSQSLLEIPAYQSSSEYQTIQEDENHTMVRVNRRDFNEELGIFIAKVKSPCEGTVGGFVVAHVVSGGLAER